MSIELLKWGGFLQIELPVPDDMVQLNTRQCLFGTGKTFKAQHWSGDFLDETMVGIPHHLRNDIVQALALVNRDQYSEISQRCQLIPESHPCRYKDNLTTLFDNL